MTTSPTIALFPEASFGAALNCVGIAQELQSRGAEPVFICHPGFTGVFAQYGFREYHLPHARGETAQTVEDYWQSFITTHRPHFNLPPRDQLPAYVAPTWEAIVDTAIAAEDKLQALLERIAPDAILLDNVIMFPAIAKAGCPWVRIVSCAETEIPDPLVPPYLSGLTIEETGACADFRREYLEATQAAHRRYNRFRRRAGLAALPAGIFLEPSPDLNLLLSPEAVRYRRKKPLAEDRFIYLDGCVRNENVFDPPPLRVPHKPLVYMSFGSLGSIDTDLVGRMIAVFATLPARFIVNVGGFPDAYDNIPDNVYLGTWFPQPSVVAQSDLFIHHGGNNGFCEALYHGVPSLIMPYCWDGHDNAQRVQATGTGLRLDRASWTPDSLRAGIKALLSDTAMHGRLQAISARMKANPGTRVAADAVLRTIANHISSGDAA